MTDPQIGTPLTPAEAEVLRHAANGSTNAEIAAEIDTSPHTVNDRLRAIYDKLGVHDRTHAVAIALRLGILALDSVDCSRYLAAVHERAAEAEQRRDQLATALDEVLRSFTHSVHPGYVALQSRMEPVSNVQGWRAVLNGRTENAGV